MGEEFTVHKAASGSARGGNQGRHFVEVRARTVNGERDQVEMRSGILGITITLPPEEWDAFRDAVKAGEFDDL